MDDKCHQVVSRWNQIGLGRTQSVLVSIRILGRNSLIGNVEERIEGQDMEIMSKGKSSEKFGSEEKRKIVSLGI